MSVHEDIEKASERLERKADSFWMYQNDAYDTNHDEIFYYRCNQEIKEMEREVYGNID